MKCKHLTRLISCALLLCLIPCILVFPVSAKHFDDVYPGMLAREFFDAINYVSDNGIMNGTESTLFSPYENVTRGMFVTILYRYSGSTQRYSSSFSDVPSNKYYYYAVGWASHYGIVNGTTSTTFEPESPLTRQQMTVILYRFARSYEGKTYLVSDFSPITTHPDYSGVSTYARESIRWAKTYHLIRLTSDTSYINATSNINRAYVALALANYAKNVAGVKKEERFDFINSPDNFDSTYNLSNQTLSYMDYCIDKHYYGNEAKAQNDKMGVKSVSTSEWKGSCFGLTYSVFLNKLGKIDFDKNFGYNASGLNNVGIPKLKSDVQNAINFYQLSQYVSDIGDSEVYYSNNLSNLYTYYRDYGAMPISYYYGGLLHLKGHSIYMTEMKKNSETNYTIFVVDPNDLNEENDYKPQQKTLKVENGSIYLDSQKLTWVGVYPTSAYRLFDEFDLDGDYNNKNYTRTSVAQSPSQQSYATASGFDSSLEDTTTLLITASQFELLNGSGESLHFDGQDFTGTMELLDMHMIINGPDTPVTFKLRVKKSNSFEYHNLTNMDVTFCTISDGSFGSISGSGIRNAAVNLVESILTVDGSSMDYNAWLSIGIEEYEQFYLCGKDQDTFRIYKAPNGVATEGINGLTVCGFSAKDSLSVETTQLSFTGADSFDLTNVASGSIDFYSQINGYTDVSAIPFDIFN